MVVYKNQQGSGGRGQSCRSAPALCADGITVWLRAEFRETAVFQLFNGKYRI